MRPEPFLHNSFADAALRQAQHSGFEVRRSWYGSLPPPPLSPLIEPLAHSETYARESNSLRSQLCADVGHHRKSSLIYVLNRGLGAKLQKHHMGVGHQFSRTCDESAEVRLRIWQIFELPQELFHKFNCSFAPTGQCLLSFKSKMFITVESAQHSKMRPKPGRNFAGIRLPETSVCEAGCKRLRGSSPDPLKGSENGDKLATIAGALIRFIALPHIYRYPPAHGSKHCGDGHLKNGYCPVMAFDPTKPRVGLHRACIPRHHPLRNSRMEHSTWRSIRERVAA